LLVHNNPLQVKVKQLNDFSEKNSKRKKHPKEKIPKKSTFEKL